MPQLSRSLVVTNAKGGVGKTTITAQLAIMAAARGHDVIAVDLDPQANLTRALGASAEEADGGASLVAMAIGLAPGPTLATTPRPRLRCLAASAGTETFVMAAPMHRGDDGLALVLGEALAPLAAAGARIFIDTPSATASPLAGAALRIAQWALMPMRLDDDSAFGVRRVLDELVPGAGATPAGVVLFEVNPCAVRTMRAARARLGALIGARARLLESTIRHSGHVHLEAQRLMLSAAEYASCPERPRALERPARQLANDYSALADELDEITTREVSQ